MKPQRDQPNYQIKGRVVSGPVDKGPQAKQARDGQGIGKVLGQNMYLSQSRKPKRKKKGK